MMCALCLSYPIASIVLQHGRFVLREFQTAKNLYTALRLPQLGPLRRCWQTRLQKNNNTFQEGWLWANQQLTKTISYSKHDNLNIDTKRFSRKQNVSPDNVFLLET